MERDSKAHEHSTPCPEKRPTVYIKFYIMFLVKRIVGIMCAKSVKHIYSCYSFTVVINC